MNSENTTDRNEGKSSKRLATFPFKMAYWTALVVVLFIGSRWLSAELNRLWAVDPGITNVVALILVLLTWVMWVGWALLFSGLGWRRRLLAALAVIGFGVGFGFLFELEHSGDMRIDGLRLRRWGFRANLASGKGSEVIVDGLIAGPTDFTGFLGPNRDGRIANVSLDTDWEKSPPKLKWKIPVGEGWAGTTIVGGFVFTLEQRGPSECVFCYSLSDGKFVWVHENPRRHDDAMMMGKLGPRSTPTFYKGYLYCQGATGTLMCLDSKNGALVWQKEINDLVRATTKTKTSLLGAGEYMQEGRLTWGRAASPLIVDDLVITSGGGPDDGPFVSMLAFDRLTGEERWRGGDEMIAYGSPNYAVVAGVPQILLTCESQAISLEPKTGTILWKFSWPGKSNGDANCSQVTVVTDDHVMLSKGYAAGFVELLIERNGNELKAVEKFKSPRSLRTKFSSPVIFDGHAYGISDGFLECVDLSSGERCWNERSNVGNGQMLLVGDKLLIQRESGGLLLVAADPKSYRLLGQHDSVSGKCWNTFALAGTTLVVRSDLEMACFELPGAIAIDSN